jgi:hypothetical protein
MKGQRKLLTIQVSNKVKDAIQDEKRKRIKEAITSDKSTDDITITSIVLDALKTYLNITEDS